MAFNIKKAERLKIFFKGALFGPSGSGKTFTSLTVATGMAKELERNGLPSKILMGNTEESRGLYYANEFDYDIVNVDPPYTPEKFIELIELAEDNGYGILIIDSTSSEWEGSGGCLEISQMLGGTYNSWGKHICSLI